ncbi:MAG: insulinase family protein [Candidatus Omnitrophica bacterium]|nr:insulinase family protein [Candidatus Omnitrophota bacterium]
MRGYLNYLPNHLGVLTIPMRDRHSVSVALWIRAGARYETKRSNGISHFLEHMLFKGTKKRSTRQIKEEIEGVGGILNAFTGEEFTCYFAKLLREHYPKALDVLSDMVNHSVIDKHELEKERTVILEEIKMYKDLPSQYVQEAMSELLWPDQALGRPIAGTEESVSNLSRKDVLDYRNQFYHTKNILVSVSGPVEHTEVEDYARKHFSGRSCYGRSRFKPALTRSSSPKFHFIEKDTEQTHFVIGLHGLSRFHPDRFKLGILNVILGGNMSSRLFEEVREKRGLAYEIRSSGSYHHDTGAVTISAGVDTQKAHSAIRVILAELGKLCRRKVKTGELRRAKDYFKGQLALALEDTLDHVLWVGERVMDRGEIPDREKIIAQIEAVTLEDVMKMANHIFMTKNLHLSLIGPVKEKLQQKIKKDFEI